MKIYYGIALGAAMAVGIGGCGTAAHKQLAADIAAVNERAADAELTANNAYDLAAKTDDKVDGVLEHSQELAERHDLEVKRMRHKMHRKHKDDNMMRDRMMKDEMMK